MADLELQRIAKLVTAILASVQRDERVNRLALDVVRVTNDRGFGDTSTLADPSVVDALLAGRQ